MTFKIAIDVTSCAYAPMSGTGVYVRQLVSEMLAIRPDIEFHLISSKRCNLDWAHGAVTWFGDGGFADHNIAWWAVNGNVLLSKIAADVFWSPFQFFPIGMSKRRKTVLTVLDLVWHRMPAAMEWRNYVLNRILMRRSLKKARAIITISRATRDDLLDIFDLKGKEVYPISLSASSEYIPADEKEKCDASAKYPFCAGPYILAVGALEPRKNHLRLAQAVELLRQEVGCDYRLVIAGSGGWRKSELLKYLRTPYRQPWVHIVQDVEQRYLKCLYSMAQVFAFPSLMEGFGIPILEAMACRCPVVTSNISSMPEVAGDAAVFVDPYDVSSIALGLRNAISRKDELKSLGEKRSADYSWSRSAAEHLAVFMA